MKIELTVPTKLNEIPLINYQKFYASQQASNDDEFIMQKIVQCFCGIELKDVAQIRMSDVMDIVTNLTTILQDKPKFEPTFKIDNIEFGFVPNLENLTFGEYVDAESYWDNVEDWHKGMAVLFRPITEKKGNKYQIYEYKGSSEFSDAMQYAPMSVVISTRLFFWNLGIELLTATLDYLEKELETKELETLAKELNLSGGGVGTVAYIGWLRETLQSLMKSRDFHLESALLISRLQNKAMSYKNENLNAQKEKDELL